MAIPLGIKIPLRLGSTGYFDPTYTSIDEAKANMYNLLLTQKGERVMQPDFGTSIYSLLFEQITRDLKARVENEIKQAVEDWLPYVQLIEVEVNISDENIENNRINIKVGFGLKRDLKVNDEIRITFAT